MNPLPVTVSVNAGSPEDVLVGEMAEIVGLGLFAITANEAALEVPPPGAGFTTVMLSVPALPRSAAVIVAVSTVALT
jgi:hypothetical protein